VAEPVGGPGITLPWASTSQAALEAPRF